VGNYLDGNMVMSDRQLKKETQKEYNNEITRQIQKNVRFI
jgi:hypothetical protein